MYTTNPTNATPSVDPTAVGTSPIRIRYNPKLKVTCRRFRCYCW